MSEQLTRDQIKALMQRADKLIQQAQEIHERLSRATLAADPPSDRRRIPERRKKPR